MRSSTARRWYHRGRRGVKERREGSLGEPPKAWMPSDKAGCSASSSAGPLGVCGRGLGVTQTQALQHTVTIWPSFLRQDFLPASRHRGGEEVSLCGSRRGCVWIVAMEAGEPGVRKRMQKCVCVFVSRSGPSWALGPFWNWKIKNLDVWLVLEATRGCNG